MKKFFLLAVMLLTVGTTMAQEAKEELRQPLPENSAVFQLAGELSRYGYSHKSALALIQAAQLVKQYNFTEEQRESADGETNAPNDPNKAGKISLNADELLSDARVLAGNDAHLIALIDQTAQIAQAREAVGGPKYSHDRVSANSSDYYNISFYGGRVAQVWVVGDGDTDLDLYIYDQNGNLITKDDDYTDTCYCSWTPRWTGNFKIVIRNRGNVYNEYYMRTN